MWPAGLRESLRPLQGDQEVLSFLVMHLCEDSIATDGMETQPWNWLPLIKPDIRDTC